MKTMISHFGDQLLCISCPSANEFSAISILLFARSNSNSPRTFQRLRRTLSRNFNSIQQQMKNFPIVKIVRFRQRYNVAKSGRFLQWGSMGKFFTRCRIWMKFGTRVHLKPYNDQGEFEFVRARSKNNIAENLFALGHETHNTALIYKASTSA